VFADVSRISTHERLLLAITNDFASTQRRHFGDLKKLLSAAAAFPADYHLLNVVHMCRGGIVLLAAIMTRQTAITVRTTRV